MLYTQIFLFLLLPITVLFLVGFIQTGIETAIQHAIKKEFSLINSKNRIMGVFLSFVLITIVVSQAIRFYLLNGAYFWLALLSFGIYLLYFLLPYLSLLIFWKPDTFLSKVGIGLIGIWSILIFIVSPTIYLDEGGVSHQVANIPLKILSSILGVGLYIFLTVTQALLIHHKLPKKNAYLFIKVHSALKNRLVRIVSITSFAFFPIFLILMAWISKIVFTESLHLFFGISLFVSLISLSNLITIDNKWINMIRYFVYLFIYSVVFSIIPVSEEFGMDKFSIIIFWFPLSVHLAFIVPMIMNGLKKIS